MAPCKQSPRLDIGTAVLAPSFLRSLRNLRSMRAMAYRAPARCCLAGRCTSQCKGWLPMLSKV